MFTSPQFKYLSWTAAALLALAAFTVLLTAGTSRAATTTVIVGQTNGGGPTDVNQYNPAAITIQQNDQVTWNSAPDDKFHDVTSYAELTPGTPQWQSPLLRSSTPDNTHSHTFSTSGTFTYYCSLHSTRDEAAPAVVDANIAAGMMVGKVTVNPPGTPTPSPSPTPTPSPTASPGVAKQGDIDCSGAVNAVDALKVLRHVAGLTVAQGPGCTPLGQGGKGDVDCNGAVNAVDALKILRWVAGLTVSQGPSCTPIGS